MNKFPTVQIEDEPTLCWMQYIYIFYHIKNWSRMTFENVEEYGSNKLKGSAVLEPN